MTSVIPKEIRRTLAIREGDPLEIYTTDGGVLFRKYEQPTGTATATAKDTFIPAVGMVIAFCRATGRPVPQKLLED